MNLIHLIAGWTFSLIILVVSLPLILLILIAVSIITLQFPIYRQYRSLALDSEGVVIYKIRTIKGEKEFTYLEEKSADVYNKSEYEKFVPPFCRWLRKSGLDEILQLLNVLKGEMRLIGPRPLAEFDLRLIKSDFPDIDARRAKLKSKPGITGCWQVWMDRDKGPAYMIELDEFYEKNKSIALDIKIIIETLNIILFSRHSDAVIGRSEKSKRLFKIKLNENHS